MFTKFGLASICGYQVRSIGHDTGQHDLRFCPDTNSVCSIAPV